MTTAIRMPDGTICRSGPNCRRHGLTAGIQAQISEAKANISGAAGFPAARVVRRGINSALTPEALQALDKEAQDFRDKLTLDEENALVNYSITSYIEINAYLRDGRDGVKAALQYLGTQSPSEEAIDSSIERSKARVEEMDSAFAKSDVSGNEPRLLYKGYRVSKTGKKTSPQDREAYVKENYQIGKVFNNAAYTSTSVDPDYMVLFARKRPEEVIVHEILTKSGVPLHEPSRSSAFSSIQDSEREILLPRNVKLKVVNITEATFEHTYSDEHIRKMNLFGFHSKKKRFTVVQMVEVD